MKFAFIVDKCGVQSYYVKNGKSYSYKTKEVCINHNSLSEKSMIGMWSYPFVFNGCYLNWSEWGDDLPDYNLEVIIVAIEKDFVNYNVKKLRKKYPNALIFGMIKEIFLGNMTSFGYTADFTSDKHKNRTKFLNECDGVFQCFKNLDDSPLSYLSDVCNKNIEYLPFSVDVNYIYENYYKNEKTDGVYMYLPHSASRRTNTYEFSRYICNKYKLPLDTKPLYEDKPYTYMSLHDLVSLWSQYSFHINLDSADWFPGSQAVQVASAGSIQVGGLNYSHKVLYPDLATNDLNILENQIDKIINDFDYRIKIIQKAFDGVHRHYSFDTVKKSLNKMMKEVEK